MFFVNIFRISYHAGQNATLFYRKGRTKGNVVSRQFFGFIPNRFVRSPFLRMLYVVNIQHYPSFSYFISSLSLCKKRCLHSTKQILVGFVVPLLICARYSFGYVNSYAVMTSTLLMVVSTCFMIAPAIFSSCFIRNVAALLCITSRWHRAV